MALDFTKFNAAQARLVAAVGGLEGQVAALKAEVAASNDPAQQAALDTAADQLNAKAAEVEATLPPPPPADAPAAPAA